MRDLFSMQSTQSRNNLAPQYVRNRPHKLYEVLKNISNRTKPVMVKNTINAKKKSKRELK